MALTRLISRPDELDAITVLSGRAASISANNSTFKSSRSGALSWTNSTPLTAAAAPSVETHTFSACAGHNQPELLQCRPGIVDEVAGSVFRTGRRIGGGHLETTGEENGCPAGADGASADYRYATCHGNLAAGVV